MHPECLLSCSTNMSKKFYCNHLLYSGRGLPTHTHSCSTDLFSCVSRYEEDTLTNGLRVEVKTTKTPSTFSRCTLLRRLAIRRLCGRPLSLRKTHAMSPLWRSTDVMDSGAGETKKGGAHSTSEVFKPMSSILSPTTSCREYDMLIQSALNRA